MTLIDKAEALALIERKVGRDHPALADELRHAIAALPARGVGVVCTWPSCQHTAYGQCQPSTRVLAALEPAPTGAAQAREAALSVAQAAQVLLDAMTARPPLADPFDACDVEVERLAIEYSGQGGDAVIVLETAEKFMLAGLRALLSEART